MPEFGAALDGMIYIVTIVTVLALLLFVTNLWSSAGDPYRHSDDKGPTP